MNLYDSNRKLKIARQRGFIFNQINKLTTKFYSSLSNKIIHYYLKVPIPIIHQNFFKILSEVPENVQTHCNDKNIPLNFAIRKWTIKQYFQSSFSKTSLRVSSISRKW